MSKETEGRETTQYLYEVPERLAPDTFTLSTAKELKSNDKVIANPSQKKVTTTSRYDNPDIIIKNYYREQYSRKGTNTPTNSTIKTINGKTNSISVHTPQFEYFEDPIKQDLKIKNLKHNLKLKLPNSIKRIAKRFGIALGHGL